MHERAAEVAKEQQQAMDTYIKQVAGDGSTADQLAKLADLKERGAITEQEFEQQKAAILR